MEIAGVQFEQTAEGQGANPTVLQPRGWPTEYDKSGRRLDVIPWLAQNYAEILNHLVSLTVRVRIEGRQIYLPTREKHFQIEGRSPSCWWASIDPRVATYWHYESKPDAPPNFFVLASRHAVNRGETQWMTEHTLMKALNAFRGIYEKEVQKDFGQDLNPGRDADRIRADRMLLDIRRQPGLETFFNNSVEQHFGVELGITRWRSLKHPTLELVLENRDLHRGKGQGRAQIWRWPLGEG